MNPYTTHEPHIFVEARLRRSLKNARCIQWSPPDEIFVSSPDLHPNGQEVFKGFTHQEFLIYREKLIKRYKKQQHGQQIQYENW